MMVVVNFDGPIMQLEKIFEEVILFSYSFHLKLTLRAPRGGGRKRPPLRFSSVVFARGMILKRNFG